MIKTLYAAGLLAGVLFAAPATAGPAVAVEGGAAVKIGYQTAHHRGYYPRYRHHPRYWHHPCFKRGYWVHPKRCKRIMRRHHANWHPYWGWGFYKHPPRFYKHPKRFHGKGHWHGKRHFYGKGHGKGHRHRHGW